jgi:hypothetical protein
MKGVRRGVRTQLLHLEGVGRLDEQVGGILVLLLATAKEAEAAPSALERLLSLRRRVSAGGFTLSRRV